MLAACTVSDVRPAAHPVDASCPVIPPPVPAKELRRGLVARGKGKGQRTVFCMLGAVSGGAHGGGRFGEEGWRGADEEEGVEEGGE